LKHELCKAFCDQLQIREVPAGLALSTAFSFSDSEPIGFYVIGPDALGRYRIEDDGNTIPMIEAEGVDLDTSTRQEALASLLSEYGAHYDEEKGELITLPLSANQVPAAAFKFVALLLRLQDLILLTPERAASTFREDASKAIRDALGTRASIQENAPIATGIEFPADLIIQAPSREPVAVFLAMSEQRVLEAVVAQMAVTYEAHVACSVIALLEKDSSVTRKMRTRASNRLTAMPIYEGDQKAAIHRIEREVLGRAAMLN
jgi:Domain of unknown function DUF1828